jgi:hypothetical protein
MADNTRIRSPVSLWDVWHKLRNAADMEATELEYLSEGRIARTYLDPREAAYAVKQRSWAYTADHETGNGKEDSI